MVAKEIEEISTIEHTFVKLDYKDNPILESSQDKTVERNSEKSVGVKRKSK